MLISMFLCFYISPSPLHPTSTPPYTKMLGHGWPLTSLPTCGPMARG